MKPRRGPGTWRLRGASERFEPLRVELSQAAAEARPVRGRRTLDQQDVYLKASALRPWPALRHAARRALGLGLPRWNELANLAWLRAAGFRAPRPLVAGVWFRRGLPRYQFLLTEWLPAPTLAEALAPGRASAAERGAWLAALARDLAQLHARGFVHRDPFARNLLALQGPEGARCAFLDAWRGGPGPGWRGPDHDLGCFLLDGGALLEPDELARFLLSYREESARAGRRLAARWPRRVERARRRVLRREAGRRPGLRVEWAFPPLPMQPPDGTPLS
ncbi:MAG TPA: lipopolysaccharide kinase InaA family protein [Planctomycetota bacterium]